jgi:hypothetical protein
MGYACCESPGFYRRYSTKDERTARLRSYAEALENELKAVKERIEEAEAA